MHIDKKQLEINVNLLSMQPEFSNQELYYIIAESANVFRFAAWNEEANGNEEKFYCFLTGNAFFIPAGSVTLNKSYQLTQAPAFPLISGIENFVKLIETVSVSQGVSKGIRRFYEEQMDGIQRELCEKYGDCERHIVTSAEAQHTLFVVKDVEISMSANMIYFRYKAPFSERHYRDVKEENV